MKYPIIFAASVWVLMISSTIYVPDVDQRPKHRFCRLSLDEQILNADSLLEVKVNSAELPNIKTDACKYSVEVTQIISGEYREKKTFSYIEEIEPFSKECRNIGDVFLLLLAKKRESGDMGFCGNSALYPITEKQNIQMKYQMREQH